MATSLGRMLTDCADACSDERAGAMARKNDETIREIGKRLRRESKDITHEPLPRQWTVMIRRLGENERRRSEEPDQPEPKQRKRDA